MVRKLAGGGNGAPHGSKQKQKNTHTHPRAYFHWTGALELATKSTRLLDGWETRHWQVFLRGKGAGAFAPEEKTAL